MAKKAGKKPKAEKAAKPRAQRLPDMDIPKSRALDRICESIAEVRETKNEAAQTEKGLLQRALQAMIDKGVVAYKAHGVELLHVKGDDRVRVRLINDDTAEGEEFAGEGGESGNDSGVDVDPEL